MLKKTRLQLIPASSANLSRNSVGAIMKKNVSGPEKRSSTRYTIDQLIRIDMDRETYVHARGINISMRGVYCELDEQVDIPSQVYMMLLLDKGTDKEVAIRCEGEVMRESVSNGRQFAAIHFTSIHPDDQRRFEQFLSSLIN